MFCFKLRFRWCTCHHLVEKQPIPEMVKLRKDFMGVQDAHVDVLHSVKLCSSGLGAPTAISGSWSPSAAQRQNAAKLRLGKSTLRCARRFFVLGLHDTRFENSWGPSFFLTSGRAPRKGCFISHFSQTRSCPHPPALSKAIARSRIWGLKNYQICSGRIVNSVVYQPRYGTRYSGS